MSKYLKQDVKVVRDKLHHQFNKTRLTLEVPFHFSVAEYSIIMEAIDKLHKDSE